MVDVDFQTQLLQDFEELTADALQVNELLLVLFLELLAFLLVLGLDLDQDLFQLQSFLVFLDDFNLVGHILSFSLFEFLEHSSKLIELIDRCFVNFLELT